MSVPFGSEAADLHLFDQFAHLTEQLVQAAKRQDELAYRIAHDRRDPTPERRQALSVAASDLFQANAALCRLVQEMHRRGVIERLQRDMTARAEVRA